MTSKKLLTCTAIATIMTLTPLTANAADISAAIEAGGTINIDGMDTFVIDNVNDGDGAASIVL